MNFYTRSYNLYLLAALLISSLVCGCTTAGHKKKEQAKMGTLRVHVATHGNLPDHSQTVKVLRSNPVEVTISGDPILSEGNVLRARVVDTPGGFAIKVKFDEDSTYILEQNSAANPGGHFVIFGQWPGSTGRWLAAPLITGRIASGELSFTPDCSYAEATNLVTSVNYAAQKIHADSLK